MDGREHGRGSAPAEASSPAGSLRGLFERPSRLLPGTTMLVISCLCLVGLGLLMVLSATSITSYDGTGASSFSVFSRQGIFAAAGMVMMVLAALTPVRVWERLDWLLIVASLFLLYLPLVSSLSTTITGSTNRMRISRQQAQCTELVRHSLIDWFAVVLSLLISLRYRPR